ncbi:hypothetical protein [Paludisphaera rhizosphaerae]|uniref:hypothetical protein n=1 Tax=Paludisphaera rhizosphaerae TaxID=2711216 RepID=UPI0013EB9F7A|nr:hypothetical protein [Paludisphaera rhizosphaerae]
MTSRELMFLFIGIGIGSVLFRARSTHEAGTERRKGMPREVADAFGDALAASVFATLAAAFDLILIKLAYQMMLGIQPWNLGVVLAIPILSVIFGLFAWASVRLVRRLRLLNRRHFGVDAFLPPTLTIDELASSKSAPHDLD